MSSAVLRPDFLVTKEYRRFAEFCDAYRRYRNRGLCTAPAAGGKTLSARRYTQWDALTLYLEMVQEAGQVPIELLERRTLFYSPSAVTTPRRLEEELRGLRWTYDRTVEWVADPEQEIRWRTEPANAELLIVDEADGLKSIGLELLRDLHDRTGIELILIGMPGLEKRLARYPQLASGIASRIAIGHSRTMSCASS